jgi:osmoprotectant transport system permease protein
VLAAGEPELTVGSKRFTESYLLGEITADRVRQITPATHRPGLGNTAVTLAALKTGAIDCYPEYLGTIELEILKRPSAQGNLEEINQALSEQQLVALAPLGFADSYALAIDQDVAARLSLSKLSQLASHPELRFGLSQEFLGRKDGWGALAQRYHLTQEARGIDHGLAYDALAKKQIDVIDIYSTDARIASDHLVVLDDDLHFFPNYDAVILARTDVKTRHPQAYGALIQMAGSITQQQMIDMNRSVEIGKADFHQVAEQFVTRGGTGRSKDVSGHASDSSGFWAKLFGPDLGRLTIQHITLVAVAVFAAIGVGIPLGILAMQHNALRAAILSITGLLQTVPTLALLAFLIPLLGRIGLWPALLALFLYGLLPIVRNTVAGLDGVPDGLKQAARALGLSALQQLMLVELPLAGQVILAGIKTATILAIGTATLAALIGAGGYGERITIGLALNDHDMLLAGAIPAACLAIAAELGFSFIDRRFARFSRRETS